MAAWPVLEVAGLWVAGLATFRICVTARSPSLQAIISEYRDNRDICRNYRDYRDYRGYRNYRGGL